MWPNEQINGISFCGALMNGENHAIFFFLRRVGGWRGTHAHTLSHTQTVRLAASNDSYINNSRAYFFFSPALPGWTGINGVSEYYR